MTKTILYNSYGWYAEVYDDDDGGSGLGGNPRYGQWYGTHAQCLAVDPAKVRLYPMSVNNEFDPFDLACERRYD